MVADSDPQWTELDRGYALAWQLEVDLTHSCGQPLAETTKRGHQFAYRAEVVRCHACATRDRAVEEFTNAGGDPAGLFVRLTRGPQGPLFEGSGDDV
ncbi:MAG TPA: hypothetical protein VFJ21_12640 [Mycobacteriales bacterium]|nr:hypothetical protein [Mycobacteriales bacterium]